MAWTISTSGGTILFSENRCPQRDLVVEVPDHEVRLVMEAKNRIPPRRKPLAA
jgi:hypothetical protein